jgi:hypothetical protein
MPAAIVSGALANKPFNGGEAWVRLSWVLGLRRLGFDVCFVEEIASADCVAPDGGPAEFSGSANRAHFDAVVEEFGLDGHAGLLCDGGRESSGLGLAEIRARAVDADLLVNISGHLRIEEIVRGPRTSLYVDLDPGFTQTWHADEDLGFEIAEHDHYATVGLNVGKPGCPIPDCGIEWIPTLPPVLLDQWPATPAPAGPLRFTTVASWRSPYGQLEIDGRTMGLKHHQFRRLIELPEWVEGAVFEIALEIHPGDEADRRALEEHGWTIVGPRAVAATPQDFRDYLSASTAEFSVAQGVYAETGSGWFSDRTAAYLASGRPALVQDTAIGEELSREEGIFTFSSLEEAVAGAEHVASEISRWSPAARGFATDHLDSDAVLGRLLSIVGVGG